MKEKFLTLYNYIIDSGDEDKMHTLGAITKAMMMRAIETSPQQAAEWIGKLESVKWRNYLTEREAKVITSKMDPEPSWSMEDWSEHMEKLGLKVCEEPYYNDAALYVTMCMICSDSGETLKKRTKIDNETDMFRLIHSLALDKLKDKDGVFNVRRYFMV